MAVAGQDDRPLALRIDHGQRAALRLGAECRVDGHPPIGEVSLGAMAQLVVSERGEEVHLGPPARESDRGDPTAAGRNRDDRGPLHDLAGSRHVIDAQELDPFDVAHNRDAHARLIPFPSVIRG